MSIRYKAATYLKKIEKLDVIKETECFVVYKDKSYGEVKESKNTQDSFIRNTFQEAKQALIDYYRFEIKLLRDEINYKEKKIERVKNLKEDADESP